MSDFPRWKYALVALVLVFGIVYALPNAFPPVPAVQVQASHAAPLDATVQQKVADALKKQNIAYTGLAIDGIGFTGIMVVFLAIVAATFLFSSFPKVKIPARADLNTGDVRHMVARTELWLESQRPALPPPAVTLVDKIGTQLDALGLQLETIDPAHPAAQETRKLVGETLPGMVDAYRRIPAHLRREQNAGASPDEQIVESLGKISGEIDQVTRQLAAGALDDLAVRTRYLDYKYGEAGEPAPENT